MSSEKFNIKIKNKPILPDLSMIDVSKELNNTDAFQRLKDDIDQKERHKEDIVRKRHKQTVLLMTASIIASIISIVLALIALFR